MTDLHTAARQTFEAWAKRNGYPTDYTPDAECGVEGGPVYADSRTHAAWWAFRYALAAQPAQEAAAWLWREKRQDLYPGPSIELTEVGLALPLGVKHALYAAPQPATQAPTAAPRAESSDWQHLKDYGYAPGGYMSRCRDCGETPTMDKRAWRCRTCAEAVYANDSARREQQAEAELDTEQGPLLVAARKVIAGSESQHACGSGYVVPADLWLSLQSEVMEALREHARRAFASPADTVAVPAGLSKSNAEFWLSKRSEIIEALRAEGLTMVTTLKGVSFMRLGKIEAQSATAPAPAAGDAWTPTSEALPEPGKFVMAVFRYGGKGRPQIVRAMHAPRHTITEDDYGEFSPEADYDEATDRTYWPEGWYECNYSDETNWCLHEDITHWMPIPAAPASPGGEDGK